VLVQAHRQADFSHGPDPPSLRATRLEGIDGGDPLLDHRHRAGGHRPFDAEAAMIVSRTFVGKRYAVLGLARSGMAAAEALLASGAHVTAWDRREGPREPLAGRATIADPLASDLTGFDGVVLSPGVPLNTHPIAEKA